VKKDSTQMLLPKLPAVYHVLQASMVIKIFKLLKVLVRIVLQENIHLLQVLQVATVATIVPRASIQQQRQATTVHINVSIVLPTHLVQFQEEIQPVSVAQMGPNRKKV